MARTFSNEELNRLGRRLRESAEPLDEDRADYDAYRAEFTGALVEVEHACRGAIPSSLGTSSRLKTLESVAGKLKRGSMRLPQIADIAGCRVLVPGLEMQDVAIGSMRHSCSVIRVNDYRTDSQCGYRAVHLIIESGQGPRVELQLRTYPQDTWANVSEALASKFGLDVKYCSGPFSVRSALEELSRRVHRADTTRALADRTGEESAELLARQAMDALVTMAGMVRTL